MLHSAVHCWIAAGAHHNRIPGDLGTTAFHQLHLFEDFRVSRSSALPKKPKTGCKDESTACHKDSVAGESGPLSLLTNFCQDCCKGMRLVLLLIASFRFVNAHSVFKVASHCGSPGCHALEQPMRSAPQTWNSPKHKIGSRKSAYLNVVRFGAWAGPDLRCWLHCSRPSSGDLLIPRDRASLSGTA